MVKPIRCTSVSNLFYFRMTLHMSNRYRWLLASKQTAVSDIWLLLYVHSWILDDRRKDRPKHVECYSKIKKIDFGASSWFYYRNISYRCFWRFNILFEFAFEKQLRESRHKVTPVLFFSLFLFLSYKYVTIFQKKHWTFQNTL